MKSTWLRSITGVSLVLISTAAAAYVEATHDQLTIAAVNQSILVTNPDLLRTLGLQRDINAPISPGASSSILQSLRTGVVAEDQGGNVIHHFFDPTRAGASNNGALTLLPVRPFTLSSPSWALEDRGDVPNAFSFKDARQYFLNALTNPGLSGRNQSFTLAFHSLGRVIHHLQDMTQPQHVRNDDHCPVLICFPFLHRPSHFEKDVNRDAVFDRIPQFLYASVYDPSNPGPINAPRRFWYTGDGKGVAEFTHRNFVSARTNFRSENGVILPDVRYGTPIPGASRPPFTLAQAYAKVFGTQVPAQIAEFCGTGTACEVEVFATSGTDLLTGQTVVNEFASSLSIFDPDLRLIEGPWPTGFDEYSDRTYSIERVFTLNRMNHESALPFLLSRAVGYSAGMINYFFRGDIRIGPNPAQPNSITPNILNYTKEPISGTVKIYYETNANSRLELRSINNVTLPAAGPAGPTTGWAVSLQEPEPSRNAKRPLQYTLVFTGDMGEERRTQSDPLGAVAGRQLSVVYGTPNVSDFRHFAVAGVTGDVSGAPFFSEQAALDAAQERLRDYVRGNFNPVFNCEAFTLGTSDWPSPPELTIWDIEFRNRRVIPVIFPQTCAGMNGLGDITLLRDRVSTCPAGHFRTVRLPSGGEPLQEGCYTLASP